MRAKALILVVKVLLVEGHHDWPNVAPYERAVYAIRSRAVALQSLESIFSITELLVYIAQIRLRARHLCSVGVYCPVTYWGLLSELQ